MRPFCRTFEPPASLVSTARFLPLALAVVLLGCGGPAAPGAGVNSTSSADLRVADVPSRPVELGAERVVIWATSEVPVGSREQAAFAGVDAILRAELLKVFEVHLGSVAVDVQREGTPGTSQEVSLADIEMVKNALPSLGLVAHGREVVRRDDGEVLVVIGRLELPRQVFDDALTGRLPAKSAPSQNAVIATSAGVSDDAPGWARKGDAEAGDGWRFVCEGQGDSPELASAAARGLCEDKICKLCGVEIESVVQTKETLKGVDMSRQVVERCRRVKKAELNVARQSSDCQDGKCLAWVQIDYAKETQEAECARYADEKFADPGACEAFIEDFRKVQGFSAASFRSRVSLVEQAMIACSQIDVRPTPLMESLSEKLSQGMVTWRSREAGAPSYLRDYWLKEYPPLWTSYREQKSFVERLRLLRDYLADKVLIMDVVEASLVPIEQLDTPAGVGRIIALLKKSPLQERYGVKAIHFWALDVLLEHGRRNMLSQELDDFGDYLRATFPPGSAADWGDLSGLIRLARHDREISEAEWRYARDGQMRNRLLFDLLDEPNHGGGDTRLRRFDEALKLALAEVKSDKPEERRRKLSSVLPYNAELFLQIETRLPADLRAQIDWAFLYEIWHRDEDDMRQSVRVAFLERMVTSLQAPPTDPKQARGFCSDLSRHLELLDGEAIAPRRTEAVLCPCLEGAMAEEGLSLVNKSELYDRAVGLGLPCVVGKAGVL